MTIHEIRQEKGPEKATLKNFDDIINKIDASADYTVRQVAELVGISYGGVLGHLRREKITSRRVFGRIYIKGKELKDYLCGERN